MKEQEPRPTDKIIDEAEITHTLMELARYGDQSAWRDLVYLGYSVADVAEYVASTKKVGQA